MSLRRDELPLVQERALSLAGSDAAIFSHCTGGPRFVRSFWTCKKLEFLYVGFYALEHLSPPFVEAHLLVLFAIGF